MNFTYNNIRKNWVLATRIKRPYWANRVLNIQRVPSMPGGHLRDIDVEPIVIPVRIEISGANSTDYFSKTEELVAWLDVNEPAPLVFDDRPERTYYAIVQGSLIPEEIVQVGYVDVLFVCPDPYKYGPEESERLFTETGTIIDVAGNAETKPVFEFDVQENITYAMVQNHLNEYMIIGQPIDVENQVPFLKYERVFYDNGTSLSNWTSASNADIDGGVVAGNIILRNNRFVAESYGTGTAWHGPALKRGLSEPLRDFRMKAFLGFFNSSNGQVGRVEIYLKDNLGRDVCKVALKDTSNGRANTWAEFRAGGLADGKYIISENGDVPGVWNSFSGQIHIEREGNRWYCYIAKVDTSTGRHHARRTVVWEDRDNKYTNLVAQVVIHIGAVGTHRIIGANSGISGISIDKINQKPDGIPYIAGPGDKIIFDFKNRQLLLNGENRKDLKSDLGGSYFSFKPGENRIALSPNALTGVTKFRPAYK